MIILGLNYIFHDSAACIIQDNEIICAVEEERLTRFKHTQSFPYASIKECLKLANLKLENIEHIAVSITPGLSDNQKLSYAAKLGNNSGKFLDYEFERLKVRNLTFWDWYHENWPATCPKKPETHFVEHHLAHAAGTYFVCPWDSAALLSIDGWGEWSTTWCGMAKGPELTKISESEFPHSLGVFYSAATEFCGFKPNYDEGKTMGLAPFGDAQKYYADVAPIVNVDTDARVTLDLSWFDFQNFSGQLCGEKFHKKFGAARKSDGEFKNRHHDVAAAFQLVLEENVVKIARILQNKTNQKRLAYAGGVALNSVANGRILREGIFDDVFLMPGAGDNGTAIGAAAYVNTSKLRQQKRVRHTTPFLGRAYTNKQIESAFKEAKVSFERVSDVTELVAKALHQGKIVGWFQGCMEFGPRSLGGRSIIADPTKSYMKRKINSEVKHREAFRPFAPSVIRECAQDYFDIATEVPYMLKVADVRPEMRKVIPAVVHVDGTARVQTVDAETAPEYHKLITAFGKLSGHPVVLNTSFNVMGEPIVESPLDALRCFYSTGIDMLAIGSFIVQKPDALAPLTQLETAEAY